MKPKKKLLRKSRLYVILNAQAIGSVSRLKTAGVDIIQLRDKGPNKETILKDALSLSALLRNSEVLFIVNDYPDIAKASCADGVHLGQDDCSLVSARKILGSSKIIGKSCHNLEQAFRAEAEGADYIGIGPVFKTPTKPEYPAIGPGVLAGLSGKLKIPFFAIGGINLENISEVLSFGAERVAVCRAILRARNIRAAVRNFKSQISNLRFELI